MKRKLLFLSILIYGLFFILGCSGYTKLDQIQTIDYFSKIKCEIPLSLPSALPTSEYLHTDDDIDGLKLKLDEIANVKGNFWVERLPYNALMIVYKDNAKNALYLIYEYSLGESYQPKYQHQYRFSDFSSSLILDSGQMDDDFIRSIEGVPIPHYLFEEMSSGVYYLNKQLVIRDNIDKFYEFYQLFKDYYIDYPMEVIREYNTLTLKNVPVTMKIEDQVGKIHSELGQLDRIKFIFSEDTKSNIFVTISIRP